MLKKYQRFFAFLVLLTLALSSGGCGLSSSDNHEGYDNVTWGNVTDGAGTSIPNGGSTSYRTAIMRGTIISVYPVTSAYILNNGESVSDLSLTEQTSPSSKTGDHTYSFEKTIELFTGHNNIVVRNITSNNKLNTSSTYLINCTSSQVAVHIQLTWYKNSTDVDLHLVKPGGVFAVSPDTDSGDCGYSNKTPDWNGNGIRNTANGGPINDSQDPALDVDNTAGYGPENMIIQTPPDGTYSVKIYYYSDHGNGTTTATVKVWINGTLSKTYNSSTLSGSSGNHSLWTPCTITASSGSYTVTDVGTLTTAAANRQEK